MKVTSVQVKIKDLVKDYSDNGENGVYGYGGQLNIRPPYQREFVYKPQQQQAVINSINKGMPLNTMYWAYNEENCGEVIDGQQRTLSICKYVNGDFSVDERYFHNLTDSEKDHILNYELSVYICQGTDKEKLDWFETINISGERLTKQELRNAVYSGTWLHDAKKLFSKSSCPAYAISSDYVKGTPIRQELLEKALEWISGGNIKEYMAQHQHDENASELWDYYRRVINWVKSTFPTVRSKEMKSVDWGKLYNEYGTNYYDPEELESKIVKLMTDDDVSKKAGIYSYLLTGKQKYLNIRAFTTAMIRKVYELQKGECQVCKEFFKLSEMEADHKIPWAKGGATSIDNCQMLCVKCNREKSDK